MPMIGPILHYWCLDYVNETYKIDEPQLRRKDYNNIN